MLCLHAIFKAYCYTFHFQCKLTSRSFLFLAFIALSKDCTISLYRETGFSHCDWHQTLHLDSRLVTIKAPNSVSHLAISSLFRKTRPKIYNKLTEQGWFGETSEPSSVTRTSGSSSAFFFFFYFKTNSHERTSAPYRTRVSVQFLGVKRLIPRSGNGKFTNTGRESLGDLNWTAPPPNYTSNPVTLGSNRTKVNHIVKAGQSCGTLLSSLR